MGEDHNPWSFPKKKKKKGGERYANHNWSKIALNMFEMNESPLGEFRSPQYAHYSGAPTGGYLLSWLATSTAAIEQAPSGKIYNSSSLWPILTNSFLFWFNMISEKAQIIC
jgi:hypothetical protein